MLDRLYSQAIREKKEERVRKNGVKEGRRKKEKASAKEIEIGGCWCV